MNDPSPLVIANHKANKNWDETKEWVHEIGRETKHFKGTVILCPSSPFIAAAYEEINLHNFKIKLGVQDISRFEHGSHTGEVAASQIKDIVGYAIIGHSERRDALAEDDLILQQKVDNAQEADISAIYCIQNEDTPIAKNVRIVAYEPPFAIGTGNPDTIDNISRVAKKVKSDAPYTFIYGGSVSSVNASKIAAIPGLDGLLVGATNSLNPYRFVEIIKSI